MRVKYSIGRTLNAGNYESIRVDVGAEDTVGSNEDEDSALTRLKGWAETKLNNECDEIEARLRGNEKRRKGKSND